MPLSPQTPSSRTFSLRYRLQASSLLAVLAGYGVLLLANRELALRDRYEQHAAMAEAVQRDLTVLPTPGSEPSLQQLLLRSQRPGLSLWITPLQTAPSTASGSGAGGGPDRTLQRLCPDDARIRSFPLEQRSYLCSSRPLQVAGQPARLHVLEDVTDDLARERTIQLMLLAAAGLSSLFTSALLRLVLRRGLRPLDRLSAGLSGIDADRLDLEPLSLGDQPEELVPIVTAFNDLLQRLGADRRRQQAFVDGVAHELRTPITLISGYAQSLRRQADAAGRLDAAGLAPLGRIEAEGQRMGRLVADLLDIAREDAGRLELRRSALDVDDALLEAFERLSPLAGGRLLLHPPPDDNALAMGDAERLQQCLTNLVENALKYAPAGSPIELYRSTTTTQVIAHVRDHGPGVPLADRERIFQRFVRASSAASGSGIGLAVVKLLMERMGGEVRVCEAPGGGAEFRLELARITPEGTTAETRPQSLRVC